MPSKPTSDTSASTAPRPTSKTSPSPEPVAPAPVPVPERPKLVRFRNRMTQLLAVQMADANGKLHHVEIPAAGTKDWPRLARLADYGVDVGIKIKRNLLSLEPVKP